MNLLTDNTGSNHRVSPWVLALMLILLSAQPCNAMDRIEIETQFGKTPNGKPAAALVVNGRIAIQLAKDQHGHPPMRTVSVMAALLSRAYRQGEVELETHQAGGKSRSFLLFLNGQMLVEATDLESKAWGVTPQDLARTWRTDLLAALGLENQAQPEFPASGKPAGQETIERYGNTSAGLLTVSSSAMGTPQPPADWQNPPDWGDHETPGSNRLSNSFQPGPQVAYVTGNAGTREYLAAIESTLRWQLDLSGGDPLDWEIPGAGTNRIAPGADLDGQVLIAYKIDSGAGGAYSGTTTIRINQLQLTPPPEARSFYSSSPSGLSRPGLLSNGRLPGLESARLVYHEQNQGSGALDFAITISNPGNEPAAIHLIDGSGNEDINSFYVGFNSAETFWRSLNSNTGSVVQIKPQGYLTILRQTLNRGYTSSGYMKLTNLTATAVDIITSATHPGTTRIQLPTFLEEVNFPVYSAPYISARHDYSAGDPWLYLRLGDPTADITSLIPGAYGCTHSFDVRMVNPNRYPELVFIVFRAGAGEVKGQFFINGDYIATPLLEADGELLLAEVPLAPGQQKTLSIQAMPLNGSYYPANIILRGTRLP